MSPNTIPQQPGSTATSRADRRIQRLSVVITERNATGTVTREVERTPGTIDIGLLRQQRDWLLSLDADSPVELARLVKADADHLDGIVNLLDAMLDSAEGYPRLGEGLAEGAAGSPTGCDARAR